MGVYLSDKEVIKILREIIDWTDGYFLESSEPDVRDLMFSMGEIQGQLGLLVGLLSGDYEDKKNE